MHDWGGLELLQISDSVLASAPAWQRSLVRSRRRACVPRRRLTQLANDEEARKKSKHVLEGDHGCWCGVVFGDGSKGKREARASEGYALQARLVDVAAAQCCRTANAAGQGQKQTPAKASARAAAIGAQLQKYLAESGK